MQSTEWRPVVGYEDRYEVSNDGQVRTVERLAEYRSDPPRKQIIRSKVLSAKRRPDGYLDVSLRKDYQDRTHLVHILVATAFIGPRPSLGMHVCHNDGDPTNSRVENLRWDTPAGNNADKRRHGTVYQLKITHCPRGHEYSPENTRRRGNRRFCRECARIHSKTQPRVAATTKESSDG